jgi:hypothetical protein
MNDMMVKNASEPVSCDSTLLDETRAICIQYEDDLSL